MKKMYDLFIKTDATQVEINPFVETDDGRVIAVDAKINFDDNAAFRQKEIFAMRDPTEEDPREVCLVHWFYATLPSCDKTFFVKGRSFSI
jgi:succinyl-CoA synthetase beta subunit